MEEFHNFLKVILCELHPISNLLHKIFILQVILFSQLNGTLDGDLCALIAFEVLYDLLILLISFKI